MGTSHGIDGLSASGNALEGFTEEPFGGRFVGNDRVHRAGPPKIDSDELAREKREATISELRRILEDQVFTDENGFYSRTVEIDTDTLREALALLESTAEDLLDSDAGLALAHGAWNEGATAWRHYANGPQPASKPVSPYSEPLLKRINQRKFGPEARPAAISRKFQADREALEAKVEEVIDRLPVSLEEFEATFESMDNHSQGNGPTAGQEHFARIGKSFGRNMEVLYGTRSDGMGNADNVWVVVGENGDLRALWTFYDHDVAMGSYPSDPLDRFGHHQNVYGGIYSDFLSLVEGSELSTYELNGLTDPSEIYPPIYPATVALFLENGIWRPLEGYIETSVALGTDGGIDYVFDEEWYEDEEDDD